MTAQEHANVWREAGETMSGFADRSDRQTTSGAIAAVSMKSLATFAMAVSRAYAELALLERPE